MTTYDKNGWEGNKNPGKLNTSIWETNKTATTSTTTKNKKDTDKNGWVGTKNPGKLNVNMWNAAKKTDPKKQPKTPPKKLDIYNESTPTSKTSNTTPSAASPDANLTPSADHDMTDDELKKDMVSIRGACQQSGCKCTAFVENKSKWSKGKCNACIHAVANHKEEWVKANSAKAMASDQDDSERKSELLKQSVKKVKKKCKTRKLSVEGGKLDCIQRIILDEQTGNEIDIIAENKQTGIDDGDNENGEIRQWMKENEQTFDAEFNEILKDNVTKYFQYEACSILAGKYILHYLKKKVGLDFATCIGGHRWALQYACVQLFDVRVIHPYGVCIKLKDVENVENVENIESV